MVHTDADNEEEGDDDEEGGGGYEEEGEEEEEVMASESQRRPGGGGLSLGGGRGEGWVSEERADVEERQDREYPKRKGAGKRLPANRCHPFAGASEDSTSRKSGDSSPKLSQRESQSRESDGTGSNISASVLPSKASGGPILPSISHALDPLTSVH